MKTTLLSLAMLLTMGASAQLATPATPVTVDLHLAGTHLEKSGKQRTLGLITTLTSAAFAGIILSMDEEQAAPAAGMLAVGATIGLVFNLSANGHEKKAGRILQGR